VCCGTRIWPWRRGRATPSNVAAGTGWRQSFESDPPIDRYFLVHRVRPDAAPAWTRRPPQPGEHCTGLRDREIAACSPGWPVSPCNALLIFPSTLRSHSSNLPLGSFVTAIDSSLADALRGRYVIERELGRGGMATVYLARDEKHDRPIALKLLHRELALGPERFLREIMLTARLDHPHILPVLDSGETAGRLWYTMPYVEAESLRNRLQRESQLPQRSLGSSDSPSLAAELDVRSSDPGHAVACLQPDVLRICPAGDVQPVPCPGD
jgi:hypothetical protein